MNKSILSFVFLFSLASLQGSDDVMHQPQTIPTSNAKRKALLVKLCSSYIASLALSGTVGILTGGVVRYLEKQFKVESSPVGLLFVILAWTIEYEFRNDIIAALQSDLDYYKVSYKKNLMFKTAWIASWLSYLQQ